MTAPKRKEITFRAWYEIKFGVPTLDDDKKVKFFSPLGIADTVKEFGKDFRAYNVSFNSIKKYLNNIIEEVQQTGTFEHYPIQEDIDFDDVIPYASDIKGRDKEVGDYKEQVEFEFKPFAMDDMDDIEPQLHKTGHIVDKIDSTYTEDGGQYGGTVTIVTGESGSGKTTVLIDKLVKYKQQNPDFKPLYISTEMTRGDLRFYKMTLPAIGQIETLLVMDYMRNGHLKKAIETAFTSGYDMIVLDSFQDLIGKIVDTMGWKEKQAQRYVIELMIDSAEEQGTAVYAIQHLTKGGTYVGSTYLKHTTTAMLELKIDNGRRYMYYSKNRRGGEMQYVPLYFDIDKELKEIVYDVEKFDQQINIEAETEKARLDEEESIKSFMDMAEEKTEAINNKTDVESQVHPKEEPELTFADIPETDEEFVKVSNAMQEMAEDIEFEEV